MILDIDGLNINYIEEGQGKVVIVLHGWGCNIDTVMPIVNILKDKYKVYALDLPGFGKSNEPNQVMGSFDYVEVVRGFMERLDIKNASFVGHSLGGKLSIIIGSKYPAEVDKIVLIDSAGLIPKRGPKYYFRVYSFKTLRFIYKRFFFWISNEKKIEKFYKKFGSDDYQNSSGIMRQILVKVVNEDLEYLLSDIKASTLIIWGDLDMDTPLYMAKTMEDKIPDCGLVVLEGTGHYSYLDDYYRFGLILKAFLGGE